MEVSTSMGAPDPRLGRSELTFADPGAFGWTALALGGTLAILGTGVTLLLTCAAHPHTTDADLFAAGSLAGLSALGGIVFLVLALRDMLSKPVWHLCEHGIVRVSKSGAGRGTMWSEIDKLEIVEVRSFSAMTAYLLRGARVRVRVPSLEIARRGQALWRTARAS
jgi:hypothetical protein